MFEPIPAKYFVRNKPRPEGLLFATAVSCSTRIMLAMEIQEGKSRMALNEIGMTQMIFN